MTVEKNDSADGDFSDASVRLISNLYDSVANEAPYEGIFEAMDEILNHADEHPDQKTWISTVRSSLAGHFAKAAHVFDILSRHTIETPLTFVERSSAATCVLNRQAQVVAANGLFESQLGKAIRSIETLLASPQDARRFADLCNANDTSKRAILQLVLSDQMTLPVLVGHTNIKDTDGNGQNLLFLSLVKTNWRAETGALLSDIFGLGDAETDILRQFVETGSVQKIAELRQRSVRTVRTQLSNIFSKMDITGQTDLAFFLATLGQLNAKDGESPSEMVMDSSPASDIRTHLLKVGSVEIDVLDYGAPNGKAVLLIQSTHPTELTSDLRVKLTEAGLRIIAPLKPGSGRSTYLKGRPGPEKMATYYESVLQQLSIDAAIVAGQASGGLYALEFAKQFPTRARSVLLIDTGVPYKSRAELMELPSSLRRTLIPARYFPDLLYLPHKIVASNFRRSRDGEANVINYFFADSPQERELTRTKREFYNVTRNLITYSFDDTERLAEDVARWASDWEELLESVYDKKPLHFFHGVGNRFFSKDRILDWIKDHPNCKLTLAPSAGQLAAFAHGDILVSAIAELG